MRQNKGQRKQYKLQTGEHFGWVFPDIAIERVRKQTLLKTFTLKQQYFQLFSDKTRSNSGHKFQLEDSYFKKLIKSMTASKSWVL